MKSVTRVAHNSYLFKGTVEENLRMGKPDANRQEMIAVLRKVNLWGFLEAQEGLDTKIQEKEAISPAASVRGSRLPERSCMILRFIFLTRQPPISMWRVRR